MFRNLGLLLTGLRAGSIAIGIACAWAPPAQDAAQPANAISAPRLLDIDAPLAGTITGHVIDEDGAPLAGIEVRLSLMRAFDAPVDGPRWMLGFDDLRASDDRVVLTNADGAFTAELIPSDHDLTLVVDPNGVRRTLHHVYTRFAELVPMDVGAVRAPRRGTIVGRVVDDAGRPVVGARVEASALPPADFERRELPGPLGAVDVDFPEEYPTYATTVRFTSTAPISPRSLAPTDMTDAQGAFELLGVALGADDWWGVRKLGKLDDEISLSVEKVGFERTAFGPWSVTKGQTLDVGTLTPRRGRTLGGIVVDADGTPVANAEVFTGRSDGPLLTAGTTTDSLGSFSFDDRPQVAHVIVARRPGTHAFALARDIEPGHDGVQLALPDPITLVIDVVDVDGSRIPDAVVLFMPTSSDAALIRPVLRRLPDRTVAVDGLAAGRIDLVVWADGFGIATRTVTVTTAGQRLSIELPQPRLLRVSIESKSGTAPVAGARVVCRPLNSDELTKVGCTYAIADANGEATVACLLDDGNEILVDHPAHAPFRTHESTWSRLGVELDLAGSVSGRIVDDSRALDEPCFVYVAPESSWSRYVPAVWWPTHPVQVDAFGAFQVARLDPGRRSLAVEVPSRGRDHRYFPDALDWPACVEFSVEPGQNARVDIDLAGSTNADGGIVRGHVAMNGAATAAILELKYIDARRGMLGGARAGFDGAFRIGPTRTGRAILMAVDDASRIGLCEVEIARDAPVDVHVDVDVGDVHGVVVDAGGAAVPRASISLHWAWNAEMDDQVREATWIHTETDHRGAYSMQRVPVGDWILQARAEGYIPIEWSPIAIEHRGESKVANFALRRAASVRGRVDLGGPLDPAFDVRVTLDPLRPWDETEKVQGRRGHADFVDPDDGAFSIGELLPGRYAAIVTWTDDVWPRRRSMRNLGAPRVRFEEDSARELLRTELDIPESGLTDLVFKIDPAHR